MEPPAVKSPSAIVAELVIKMDATGNVSLSGPIENRMICYGLLETARDMIHELSMKARDGKKVTLASAGLAGVLKGGGN